MHQEDQRNLIIAMVAMVLFVLAYQALFADPAARQAQAAREAREAAAATAAEEPGTSPAPAPATDTPATAPVAEPSPIAESARINFDGPSVDGSVRLAGALIDDLKLKRHFTTVERDEELRLLRPEREEFSYYATYLWRDAQGVPIAGVNTPWDLVAGDRLAPGSPLTLRFEGGGVRIERILSLDENYMFSFEDTVTNISSATRRVSALGVIRRHGEFRAFLAATDPSAANPAAGFGFKGLVGVLNGDLKLRNYQKLNRGSGFQGDEADRTTHEGGWVALSDKYFMTALAPQQDRVFTGSFYRREARGEPLFELWAEGGQITLGPGEAITSVNRVFAGAKELDVLNGYKANLSLPRFDDAVDWGIFYFMTKPFFWAILQLKGLVGSFGLAILAFTILVKLVLYPLYNRSYRSMAKMKLLQEPMKEINERFAADPKRKQQEIMKLFQEHKANPIAGCLPILATMPVFFALYQTLAVTLEMRHEPFLFIQDLSAPDPTAIGNLFGLIPFWSGADAKAVPILGLVIGIGILPVAYGLTMWALQSLNPPPTDPMQRRIIMFLPIIFTFVFAGFAAGLVIYWLWSNILTIIQQYVIMRRNGVETEFDKLIARLRGRGETEA
ncbi:MAG: membrane protein insertase YidC [Pseudomonadota bacterium]